MYFNLAMRKFIYLFFRHLPVLIILASCTSKKEKNDEKPLLAPLESEVILQVLGTAQDAGSPQMNCQKSCCKSLWGNPQNFTPVVSLGLTDHSDRSQYLFEASPNIRSQWNRLAQELNPLQKQPSGIFLTHAHMGHYLGLAHLGREAMGAKEVPVYALPRLANFLTQQGPWSQLVTLNNIRLHPLKEGATLQLNQNLQVKTLLVPHRDEFSETAAFIIQGPNKKALFVPDIDKWHLWEKDLNSLLAQVDYAFIDATFYDVDELPGRNMSEIPHPFVVETLEKVAPLPIKERQKIYLIHFNHTNPLLHPDQKANRSRVDAVESAGLHIARIGQRFTL